MRTVILAITALALSSCAPTSGAHREYDVTINIQNNSGPVTLTSPLKVDSISAAEQTSNPVISPTTRLQLTEGGSTAAGEASTLSDVASKLVNDLSKQNSDNPSTSTSTNTTNQGGTTQPDKDEEAGISPGTATDTEVPADPALVFNKEETFNFFNVGDGGRQAWRIPKKGTDFGKTIKLTFADGYECIIPNTSVRFALPNGLIYRPGTDKKGEPTNSIETSHGGVYLYAPTGNKSKWVKFSY